MVLYRIHALFALVKAVLELGLEVELGHMMEIVSVGIQALHDGTCVQANDCMYQKHLQCRIKYNSGNHSYGVRIPLVLEVSI